MKKQVTALILYTFGFLAGTKILFPARADGIDVLEPQPVSGISLSDPNLKVELLDTHPDDFFLSHDMDLAGRLYLGAREGVFVYERTPEGDFLARRSLYRFPADTWVYDLESFGEDLLILSNTALYRLRNARSPEPKLEKILWGNPLGHHHQGLHGMEFAPNGSLLVSMGDPHPGVHLDKTRPDHLWMWTWYVGPNQRKVPYAGVGAVMRLDLSSYDLSVYASGLRNPCGISFDRDWHLFANDNDQEGSTANPCKLMRVPRYSLNGWARGWDASQNPNRLDEIPNVNWSLDVPVGQGYYDHPTLGPTYRGSLFVANWGSRSVDRYPIQAEGAGFRADSIPFLQATGDRRPVSVMPTNDGRLIVSVCYMKGNEASPQCQTDLLLVSPRKTSAVPAHNRSGDSLVDLLAAPVQLRAKAHRELLRSGGAALAQAAEAFLNTEPSSPAFSSLVFLAAANGDKASAARITELTKGTGRPAALAWRAAATTAPVAFQNLDRDAIDTAAAKHDDPKLLTGLIEFLHASTRPPSDAVASLAAHDDPFVRQAAAILLARRAAPEQLNRLAKGDAYQRLAAALATSFRIWEQAEQATALPEGSTEAVEKRMRLLHPGGPIDLRELSAPVGTFNLADWWKNTWIKKALATDFGRLKRALEDEDARVAHAAAVGLFFLADERVDAQVASVLKRANTTLSIEAAKGNKKKQQKALAALKNAQLATNAEVPEAFRGIDWDGKTAPAGDVEKGQTLFTERGCVACHLAPHDGAGGSIGPTMVGIGERFPPSYLAASMLVPNQTVSPNFHPNTITMKDGVIHTGFVEAGAPSGQLNLRIITGQTIRLNKAEIVKQDASEQSMMPAGLIQTPQEMADMIAYLRGKSATEMPGDPLALNHFTHINPLAANAFHFSPVSAKYVRVKILDTNRGQPCIDELEIYAAGSSENLARSSHEARANASSLLKGYEKHKIQHLNDGKYGNLHSWIPAEKESWAQIELANVAELDRVVLSRDRGGALTRRVPIAFDILVSTDGKKWIPVKKVRPPSHAPKGKPAAEPLPALDDSGFVPIFDGRSLDAWDFRKGAWGLRDGTISCTGKEKTRNWIIWRGGRPSDFVLRLAFKYGTGNSGVQVRSDDLGDHQVFGYQVEIAAQAKMGLWHHSLLDKADPAREARHLMATAGQEVVISADGKKTVKQVAPKEEIVAHFREDGWNSMEIIAQGNTLVQKINGVVFSKVTDDDHRMSRRKGVIALQDHGKGCQVAFRNIRIKELKQEAGPAPHKQSSDVRGEPNPNHPNIVLILADDFGWGDTSCNNPDSPIKTPQIDRIAAEGIRFTNAHTPSAVCTPTRYGLLTGRYPWRSYLKARVLSYYAPALIPKGRVTLPSYLKTQGYRTGGFGKWHLGLDWTPKAGDPQNWRAHWETRDKSVAKRVGTGIDHTQPFGNAPTDIGFDTYFGTPSNAGRLPFFIQDNRVIKEPAVKRDTVDDLYVDRAIAFMEVHEEKHADRPFFVYLPLNAIHGAVELPKRFKGKTGMTQREDKIHWVEQSVGRILDALDRMKLAEDTLLIFTTDNGPLNSPVAREKGHQPAGPYRGIKTEVWDGGTRVPFVARWPGHIPAETTSDALLCLTDMLATVAALCGAPLPHGAGPDSVNQLPLLLQQKEQMSPRPPLVTASYLGFLTLRDSKWKAVFGTKWAGGHISNKYGVPAPKGTPPDHPSIGQLYDLEQDPGEKNDLWERRSDIVERLRLELARIKNLDPSDPLPPGVTNESSKAYLQP